MRQFIKLLIPLLILFSLSCATLAGSGTGSFDPTPTPIAPLTFTPQPKPTSTLKPTATKIPNSPTPASLNDSVQSGFYEVSIVKVRKLYTVYSDATHYWDANPGYLFLELGIKVKSLSPGTESRIDWGNVYVQDSEGGWYPNWGVYKAVADGVDVSTVNLIFAEVEQKSIIVFDDVVFLRAIWTVTETAPFEVLFGLEDSPQIRVTLP